MQSENNWNKDSAWQWFCSPQAVGMSSSINIGRSMFRQIAPCNEPKETPIEVQVETHTDYFGRPYKQKVIKEVDNQDQVGVG